MWKNVKLLNILIDLKMQCRFVRMIKSRVSQQNMNVDSSASVAKMYRFDPMLAISVNRCVD